MQFIGRGGHARQRMFHSQAIWTLVASTSRCHSGITLESLRSHAKLKLEGFRGSVEDCTEAECKPNTSLSIWDKYKVRALGN